jgi:kynureninase
VRADRKILPNRRHSRSDSDVASQVDRLSSNETAFIYVRPDLQPRVAPALSGWMGHAAPFAFELSYRPAPAIERLRAGTPPVLSMAALDAALDVFEGVDMFALRKRSIALSEDFNPLHRR